MWRRVLSQCAALLALAVAAAGSAAPSPKAGSPRVLASFPGIARAVAFDGSRVAWIETTWELRIKPTAPPRASRVIRWTSQYKEYVARDHYPRLLLGGGRIAWLSERATGSFYGVRRVYEGSATTARPRRIRLLRFDEAGSGDHLTALGGTAARLAYGVAHVTGNSGCDPDCSYRVVGGGVWLSDAGAVRRLPAAPPAALVARSGDLVAVVPADRTVSEEALRILRRIELRSARTGALARHIDLMQTPIAIAQSPTTVAVLSNRGRFEWYDTRTGARSGSIAAPPNVVWDVRFAGRYLIFRDRRSVWALDTGTGRLRRIATTRPGRRPVALATSGRTVVWAEAIQPHPDAVARTNSRTRILAVVVD